MQASHITAQVLSATGVGSSSAALPPWRFTNTITGAARGTAPSTMDLGGLSQAGPPAVAVGTPAPLARAAAAADKPIAIASASDSALRFGPPAYPPPPQPLGQPPSLGQKLKQPPSLGQKLKQLGLGSGEHGTRG